MSDNNVGTVGHQLKNRWRKEGKGLSLKQFARKLAASGEQIAKDWFDCKRGVNNQQRLDANIQRVAAEKQASKSVSRK